MQSAMRKIILILGMTAIVSLGVAAELEAGHSAYVIRDGQSLLADKDPDSAVIGKLKTHHAYIVVQISGNWVQLKTDSGTGWIYQANLSRDEPPEVNTAAFNTEASSTTLNAAARGIDNDAKGYANRKGEAESADDVVWMEKENDAVTKDGVRDYLKAHKLGEYSEGK